MYKYMYSYFFKEVTWHLYNNIKFNSYITCTPVRLCHVCAKFYFMQSVSWTVLYVAFEKNISFDAAVSEPTVTVLLIKLTTLI